MKKRERTEVRGQRSEDRGQALRSLRSLVGTNGFLALVEAARAEGLIRLPVGRRRHLSAAERADYQRAYHLRPRWRAYHKEYMRRWREGRRLKEAA